MQTRKDTRYFDKLLDDVSSFDLCITQQEAIISASVAAMEMETRTKYNNDSILLNIITHEQREKSVKRKEGPKHLEEKINSLYTFCVTQ